MAVGESAGSVYVTIDGDISPLAAKYAQAESLSRAAGAGVAAGFNTAAAATAQADASIRELIVAIREEGAAASLAAQRSVSLAGGIRQIGQAAHGSVSELQAVGGAIRVGLGEQSIRAVERFLTLIPGLGAALQVAFPVIGAIALGSAIVRAATKSDDLTKALEDQAQAAKEADDAETHLIATLDELAVRNIGRQSGPAAEAKARVTQLKMEAQDAQDVLLGLQSKLKQVDIDAQGGALTHPVGTLTGSFDKENAAKRQTIEEQISKQLDIVQEKYAAAGDAALEAGKKASEQGGAMQAQSLRNQEGAAARFGELSKSRADAEIEAQRQAARASDNALHSQQARMISEADAEVEKAKASQEEISGYALATRDRQISYIQNVAAAESAGKSQSEQQSIGLKAAGDIQKAKDDYTATIEKAQEATSTAVQAQASAYVTAAREEEKAQKDFNQEMEHTVSLEARWADLKSVTSTLDQERFKTSQRGGLLTDPRLQGTDMMAALQASEKGGGRESVTTQGQSQSEKNDLQQQLAAVQKVGGLLQDELAIKQRILQIDIQSASVAGKSDVADKVASANVALQQTLAQWRTLDLGNAAQDLEQVVVKIPDELGGALANSIFNAPKKGESKGQEIEKGVVGVAKDAGKELLTQLISQAIKFVIGQVFQTTATITAMEVQTGALITAMTLNTQEIVTAIGIAAGIDVLADGTDFAKGGTTLVGEKGPEIVNMPRGAEVIPNHKMQKFADGTRGSYGRPTARTSGMNVTVHAHAHGINNPEAFARQAVAAIPHELKRQSSSFSPYSS